MVRLETDRLAISPIGQAELSLLIDQLQACAPELSAAYAEMLALCVAHPQQRLWYTAWRIETKSDCAEVGYAGFKGLQADGSVEIGYGVDSGCEGHGYATEAVRALCRWALT